LGDDREAFVSEKPIASNFKMGNGLSEMDLKELTPWI
jgi:hypothetical protein